MIKIGALTALTLILLLTNFPAKPVPAQNRFSYSKSIINKPALTVDAPLWGVYIPQSGQIISSSQDAIGIASLTKLFTALAALKNTSHPDQLLVPEELPTPAPLIGFIPKSNITFSDALQATLISSGNDAAAILGSVNFSAARELPQQLGLTATEIVEPTGLNPHNISSVQNMLLIGALVVRNPLLKEIVSQKTFTFENRVYSSTNQLLGKGLSGIKTGYLPETGAHLLGLTESDPAIITLVMGTPTQAERFQQTSLLLNQLLRQGILQN